MNHKFHLPAGIDLQKEYTDEELMKFIEIEEYKPQSQLTCLEDWFVVDGIPIVPSSKIDKLKSFFGKYFKVSTHCDIIEEDGKTTGLMFVKSAKDISEFDGKMMDKKHTLSIVKLLDVLDEDQEIVKESKPVENITEELIVFQGGKAVEANKKELTDKEHNFKNLKLYKQKFGYIDEDWIVINDKKYKHPNAKDYFFSPKENFMISWSTTKIDAVRDQMPFECNNKSILIWNLEGYFICGLEMKDFDVASNKLKFTDDDAFFAYNDDGKLQIFNLKTLESKFISVNANKFDLQPIPYGSTDYKLVYYTLGQQNMPARVCLIDFDNQVLASRNLFNVHSCDLYFDPRGIYLLATITKINKSKKVTGTSVELFKLKDKGIPVESTDFAQQRVTHVAWDPKSPKVVMVTVVEQKVQQQAVITRKARSEDVSPDEVAANGVPNNMTVRFLEVSKGKAAFEELLTLEDTSLNYAIYSPAGRVVCLAGTKSLSKGNLVFYDTGASDGVPLTKELFIQNNKVRNKKEVADGAHGTSVSLTIRRDRIVKISEDEHYKVSKLSWDPTGRYLCTLCLVGSDAGYRLYDLKGSMVLKNTVKFIENFVWKQPVPILLDNNRVKRVKQSLNNYIARFEAEDEAAKRETSKAELEKIESGWAEWVAFRERAKKWRDETKSKRLHFANSVFSNPKSIKFEDYYSDSEDFVYDLKPNEDKFGYLETIEIV
eukprot:NODE_476_length_6991_cov_0.522635.p2 type:complete len:714 gc:universal NODE_476_length_6991_cov_0.522635:1449-3590(+)